MITEDYISFENAHLLKNAGFNEVTSHVYSDTKELLRLTDYGIKDLTNKDCDEYPKWQFLIEGVSEIISAPTIQMAMKWLREEHKIHLSIVPSMTIGKFKMSVYYDDYTGWKKFGKEMKSYEEACNKGISYILKNLI